MWFLFTDGWNEHHAILTLFLEYGSSQSHSSMRQVSLGSESAKRDVFAEADHANKRVGLILHPILLPCAHCNILFATILKGDIDCYNFASFSAGAEAKQSATAVSASCQIPYKYGLNSPLSVRHFTSRHFNAPTSYILCVPLTVRMVGFLGQPLPKIQYLMLRRDPAFLKHCARLSWLCRQAALPYPTLDCKFLPLPSCCAEVPDKDAPSRPRGHSQMMSVVRGGCQPLNKRKRGCFNLVLTRGEAI